MNVIIDYNVGNIHNLKNALDFGGIENKLVTTPLSTPPLKNVPTGTSLRLCIFIELLKISLI